MALVVGGGGGDVGSAVASELAMAGADVVLSYLRDDDSAAAAVNEVSRHGMSAHAIRSDATQPAEVAALFDAAVGRHGHLDIVVHVVGAVMKKPLAEVSDADFDHTIATNLRSVFLTMRGAGNTSPTGAGMLRYPRPWHRPRPDPTGYTRRPKPPSK